MHRKLLHVAWTHAYILFDARQVCFTVLIESNKYFPEQQWEAVLWHNACESGEWRELSLREISIDESKTPVRLYVG